MTVPAGFAFAVKIPRAITHERRLKDSDDLLERFLAEITELEAKLGPLLVQLPPSLGFQTALADQFFTALRRQFSGQVACEPRHASWFGRQAEQVMKGYEIARVAVDPALVPAAAQPGGWGGLAYYRLHGSPRMYYSPYTDAYLATLAQRLRKAACAGAVWCIFDNTAQGAATTDALAVLAHLATQ
jgi:uncharacterized protein YecE (DUF72 family)